MADDHPPISTCAGSPDLFNDPSLPSLTADLAIHYPILSGDAVTDDSSATEPSVALDNITLNFGSFFASLLGPILQDVNAILGPIQPILDFLNGPVPVLSDLSEEVGLGELKWDQLLELAASLVAGADFDSDAFNEAVSVLATIVDLAKDVDNFAADGTGINFGNYSFDSGFDLRTSTSSLNTTPLGNIGTQTDSNGQPVTASDIQNQISNDPMTTTDPSTGKSVSSGGLLSSLEQETGLDFPLLDNPLQIVQLIMGQNVTLVKWTMPTISIDVPIDIPLASIPVGPFDVTVLFTGDVGITFNGTVGLDTSGLKSGKGLLAGLFFGTTQPLLDVDVSVGAGVEVGVYIVSVGLDMQFGSNLAFGFADLNHNGMVYLNQITSECAFEESGDVFVKADFLLTFGISIFSYTVSIPIVPRGHALQLQ